jgi:uncharacterized protein YdgA (DUF945 family)
MNKIKLITANILLIASFGASFVIADDKKPINLSYTINDNKAIETSAFSKNAPLKPILEILEKSIEAAKKINDKIIKTKVSIPNIEEFTKKFNILPLNVETVSHKDGTGKIILNHQAFTRNITDENNQKGQIIWQGLQGELTYIGLLEEVIANLNIPKLKIQAKDKFDAILENLALKFTLNKYNEPIKFDFKLPNLSLKSNDLNTEIKINNVVANANFEEVIEGLQIGGGKVSIGTFNIKSKGETIQIKNLQSNGTSKLSKDKKLVSYISNISLEKLTIPKSIDKIGIGETFFDFDIILSNLDAKTTAELIKTIRKLKKQGLSNELIGMSILGKLIEFLPELIKNSPKINIKNFNFKNDKGLIKAQFVLSIDGKKPFDLGNIETIKQALISDVDLSLPKKLIKDIFKDKIIKEQENKNTKNKDKDKKIVLTNEEIDKMVAVQMDNLVKEKLFILKGNDLILKAKLANGKLKVNGKDFPLPF